MASATCPPILPIPIPAPIVARPAPTPAPSIAHAPAYLRENDAAACMRAYRCIVELHVHWFTITAPRRRRILRSAGTPLVREARASTSFPGRSTGYLSRGLEHCPRGTVYSIPHTSYQLQSTSFHSQTSNELHDRITGLTEFTG